MLEYIHEYMNSLPEEFNDDFLNSKNDLSIEELVIMCMKEIEIIKNYEILSYEIIRAQDEIDYNYHTVNINFKKKNVEDIKIPKYKYIAENRYGEIIFTIKVKTNLNEKIIQKRLLLPLQDEDGFYVINNKRWKSIWQLVDASTYSQRGKITFKSRMPIIIYGTKKKLCFDIDGNSYEYPSYSYALTIKVRRNSTKTKIKFIHPLMIFSAKMGLTKTIEFFGYSEIIDIVADVQNDKDEYRYYPLDTIFIKIDKELVDNHQMIQGFVCMLQNLQNKDFPVTIDNMDELIYWRCRIGYIGSVKNKNLYSFEEKGKTTIFMVERLLDIITTLNLRLPKAYKYNVYYVLRWMIENYDSLKNRNNMDFMNKRIRKNEYIVLSSLGKKISENINKIIEKVNKSRMNNMETLLELFNFNSDIIIAVMRNINDLIKSDELVNDLTFLQDIAYSTKGPNSLGEGSDKIISSKYRALPPSAVGIVDLNTSNNSAPGLAGAFTPFVQLFNNYFFSEHGEPCDQRFKLEKIKHNYFESKGSNSKVEFETTFEFNSLEEYLDFVNEYDDIRDELRYESIEIVEKEEDENVSDFDVIGGMMS